EGNLYIEPKEERNKDEVTQSKEKDTTEEELMSQLGESNLDKIIATEKDTEENQDNKEISKESRNRKTMQETSPNTLIEQKQKATIGKVVVPMDKNRGDFNVNINPTVNRISKTVPHNDPTIEKLKELTNNLEVVEILKEARTVEGWD
ncbi:19200_t:CDS:2, partial [Gigaspora rosea]